MSKVLVYAVSGKKRIIQIALTPTRIVVIYKVSQSRNTDKAKCTYPEVPSPTQVFSDEPGQNKAQRPARSKKQDENTHLPTAFVQEKQILDHNCRNRLGARAEKCAENSCGNETAERSGLCAP